MYSINFTVLGNVAYKMEYDLQELTMDDILLKNSCVCQNEIIPKDYSQAYAVYNFIIVIILIPMLAVFGLITNIFNMYVFTRNSMITPTNMYLVSLARSDFLVVISGMFIFCLDSMRGYVLHITDFATKSIVWVMPLGYITQTCSVYCTVGAAVNCYVELCCKKASTKWCTVGKARIIVVLIVVFSLAYNCLRFWQFFLHPCYYHDTLTVELCVTQFYDTIYVPYTVYIYTALMVFVPFVLLTVLNSLILRKVQEQKHLHVCPTDITAYRARSIDGAAFRGNSISHQNVSDVDDPDVMTLVVVVILFLGCNFLSLVINIIEAFFQPDPVSINYLNDMSNFLVIFNSSVNFVVYVIFDASYRKIFSSWCTSRRRYVTTIQPISATAQNGLSDCLTTTVTEWDCLMPSTISYYSGQNSLSVQTFIKLPKNSIDFVTSICFNGQQNNVLETEV